MDAYVIAALTITTQHHRSDAGGCHHISVAVSVLDWTGIYNAVCNARQGAITVTNCTANVAFIFSTDYDLEVKEDWQGVAHDNSNFDNVHEICVKTHRYNYGEFTLRTCFVLSCSMAITCFCGETMVVAAQLGQCVKSIF